MIRIDARSPRAAERGLRLESIPRLTRGAGGLPSKEARGH